MANTVTARAPMRDLRKGPSLAQRMKKYWALYVILGIIMAYYLLFNYYPIVMGVLMSLKTVKIGMNPFNAPWATDANGQFSLFQNYMTIFKDREIVQVIINTLNISVMRLLWGFWPPILLAICIFDVMFKRYKKICQTVVYIPYFFSWVIIYGIVFAFFSANGFVNTIGNMMGMGKTAYLSSPAWFVTLLIGSQIWKGAGWGTILYFAALTGVNPELYEAARIDGAGPIRRTIAVTLPAMLPVITFNLILSLGNILATDFDQILMFYNAAVYSVGDVIDTWVYRVGLGKMQYSVGSAVGLLKAVVSLVLIVLSNMASRRVAGRGLW